MSSDTNYRSGIRQLRFHTSTNEFVRQRAIANGEPMAAIYTRLAKAAAAVNAAPDPIVRQRVDIDDETWEKLRAIARSRNTDVSELIEEQLGAERPVLVVG